MSGSARRLWVLAGVFLLAVCTVGLHLAVLTIGQHDAWRLRSYRNRWAFRDVPTRRGSLLDRHGEVIATDRPGFELLGNYREFRRRHAVGAAVHGANLLSDAERWVPDYFGYRDHPGDPVQAFEVLMQLPLRALGRDFHAGKERAAELARDLRFYAAAVLSACTGRSRRGADGVDVALSRALIDRRAGPVWRAVVDDWAELRRSFVARWEELRDVDRMLGSEPGAEGSLIDVLEGWRHRRREVREAGRAAGEERVEWVQEDWFQPVQDRLSFDLAARIRAGRIRHPGLHLAPSVRRVYAPLPGRQDAGSLQALIGGVTVLDRADLAGTVGEKVRGALQGFRPGRPLGSEPEEVVATAGRSAEAAMRRYFQRRGRTGALGAESALEEVLAGTPGLRWTERSRVQERYLLGTLDVAPGADVRLTLDLRLQGILEAVTEEAFSDAREVSLAVIDAERGDVLAVGGRPLRVVETAADGTEREFLRRWPPGLGALGPPDVGSVAKPFVLLEHLTARRQGLATTRAFSPCTGRSRIGGVMLGCGTAHGAVTTDPVSALARSCNQFFFQVAAGIGAEGVRRSFERVGWKPGAAYQVDIAGIGGRALPVVRPGSRSLAQQSIGYGVHVSALYVARAYGALFDGALPFLRLVDAGAPAAATPLGVHPDDLATVHRGLRECVLSGTARDVAWPVGLQVYGKTGTAEITAKGHNNAWFAGFLPTPPGVPPLAFAAVAYFVPDRTHGGDVAAEMVAEFLRRVDADEELRARYLRGEGAP